MTIEEKYNLRLAHKYADYIIVNNANLRDTGKKFNTSRQNVSNKIYSYLEKNDPVKWAKVRTIFYNNVANAQKRKKVPDERIVTIFDYLIENKATHKKTAEKFDISLPTLSKYLTKLKDIDEEKYNTVKTLKANRVKRRGKINRVVYWNFLVSVEDSTKIGLSPTALAIYVFNYYNNDNNKLKKLDDILFEMNLGLNTYYTYRKELVDKGCIKIY